jgi:hypothetical protein
LASKTARREDELMKRSSQCIVFTVLSMLFAGCATVDTRWQKAASTNTVQAYEAFLKQHPDSDYTGEAGKRVESLEWENAKKRNRLSSYEAFLQKYPGGAYSAQARAELQSCAKVVVDFPKELKSYHNIGGPVWIYTPQFKELNGVAATITMKKMQIYTRYYTYGDHGTYREIKKVKVPARGTGSYTSWVRGKSLAGGRMRLDYIGTDENGHDIHLSLSIDLEE